MTEPMKPDFDDVLPAESNGEVLSVPPEAHAPPTEDEPRKTTDDVMDLIASVEDQLEKMKSAQVNRSSEIETLESRRENLTNREQGIQTKSKRLEKLELELETRLENIVERENQCSERNLSVERMSSALAADSDDMSRREKELSDLRAEFEEGRNNIVLEQGRLAGERAELEAARADFEVEADQLKNELESAHEAVSATESIRVSLEEQADHLRTEHEQMMHRIEESDSRADSFKVEVESLQAGTIELAGQLESAADVIEKLESERAGIDDEMKSCMSQRDESYESARSAIDERDEIKASLEMAMDRLQALAQAVSEQASQLDEGAMAISRCRELEERMVTLSRELEEAHDQMNHATATVGDLDPELLSRSNEELSRLKAELESCVSRADHDSVVNELNARIEAVATHGSDSNDDLLTERLDEARCEIETLESHARECEERITEKDRHLAELQMRNEELESTPRVERGDVSSDSQLLRDQAKRLSAFASHLQLRRVRLREMRRLLADRVDVPGGQTASTIDSERLIRVGQEDMVRRRHEMSELESRMLRRWACHTTAGTVVKLSILLLVLASACWFGTRWFAPGTVASTALVRAQPITGGVLDDSTAASWNEWHKAILTDDLFVKSVFSRFQSSSLGGIYSAEAASKMLGSNLVVTEVEPGMLQIRLHGSSPLETQRLLENVVATLSSESQRQLARRGDGARVDIVNTDGRLVVNDPVPVTRGQFQTAGLAFGGSVVVLGLLGSGVYARLRRSRRIFDENIGIDSSSID
jgi:chromosome segregation ATPase